MLTQHWRGRLRLKVSPCLVVLGFLVWSQHGLVLIYLVEVELVVLFLVTKQIKTQATLLGPRTCRVHVHHLDKLLDAARFDLDSDKDAERNLAASAEA